MLDGLLELSKRYDITKDLRQQLLEQASNGCVDSLDSFINHLTFIGESTTPYIKDIAENKSNPFTLSYLQYTKAQSFQTIHNTFINSINLNDFNTTEPLNIESLVGHIDYDRSGVVYIKSPQMTYKTQSLKELMLKIPKDWGVYLIGHRRSLLRKTANDLGLELYEEIISKSKGEDLYEYSKLKRTKRLAITWHSLYKVCSSSLKPTLNLPKPHIVIFDESDQIFIDFYTADKKMSFEKRKKTDEMLHHLVKHSKLTVCLDADISKISKQAMDDYKPGQDYIYVNNFPVFKDYSFTFMTEQNIFGKMCYFLDKGEPIYITCEHKGEVFSDYLCCNYLHKELKDYGFEGIAIHQDNQYEYQEIITNTNAHIPGLIAGTSSLCKDYGISKLQYLITSPTLQTGWSCGTPGERYSFKRTFGVFPGYPNKHYTVHSIRQAVRRARCVKDHYLYINRDEKNPPRKDILSIMAWLNKKGNWRKKASINRVIDVEKGISYLSTSAFDNRYLNALQHQELSRSNRYIHTRLLFEEYGGIIETEHHRSERELKKLDWKERVHLNNQNIHNIMIATELTEATYDEIKDVNTDTNKITKAKFKARVAWHNWGKYKNDTNDRPTLTPLEIKRWDNGDITKCYELRDIANSLPNERTILDLRRALADKNYDDTVGEILDRFYKSLHINPAEVYDKPKDVILFRWNIPVDTIQYLTQPILIDVMNWVGVFGEANTEDMDVLTFFNRVAKALDYDSRLYQPYGTTLKEEYIRAFNIPRTTGIDARTHKVKDTTDVAKHLLQLCMEHCKKNKLFVGIHKKMEKRELTKNYFKELFFDNYDLFNQSRRINNIALCYFRYTHKHLRIINYETYPIGLLSKLTDYDVRGEKHKCSVGLSEAINDLGEDYDGFGFPSENNA